MTALEIIIASCLGVGPALLGVVIGVGLAAAYEVVCNRRNEFALRRLPDWLVDWVWVSDEQVGVRQAIMFVFWSVVGIVLGGFASGAYVQSFIDLVGLLGGR